MVRRNFMRTQCSLFILALKSRSLTGHWGLSFGCPSCFFSQQRLSNYCSPLRVKLCQNPKHYHYIVGNKAAAWTPPSCQWWLFSSQLLVIIQKMTDLNIFDSLPLVKCCRALWSYTFWLTHSALLKLMHLTSLIWPDMSYLLYRELVWNSSAHFGGSWSISVVNSWYTIWGSICSCKKQVSHFCIFYSCIILFQIIS